MNKAERQPRPEQGFDFSENEKLFDRLSDKRFRRFLFDSATTIHKVGVDSNNYGEFLFVTMSRAKVQGRELITCFGYGYHEYRDRWFSDEWHWYQSNSHSSLTNRTLTPEEAKERLDERQREIAPQVQQHHQSRQGQLFELFADLADDDGIIAEMEDLGYPFDDLD